MSSLPLADALPLVRFHGSQLESRPMLLLGHRGSRGSGPARENTLAAFDLALEHGCNGFEFDVRLTCDGIGVVCHNPTFGRQRISKTAASRLPALPTLRAVLERYSPIGFLDIELKVPGVESQLHRLLSRHSPKKGFVVSSFQPGILLEFERLDSTVPLGLICESARQLRRWRELPIECVVAHRSLTTRRLLDEVHDAGKHLYVWTVNRASDMVRLAEWGVDGIISDRTDTLGRTLRPGR